MRLARPLVLLVLLGALLAPGAFAQDQQTVRLFFTAGEQFETVERKLPATGTTLLPTLRALLKGPSAAERGRDIDTQIPRGVRIERIVLTGRGAAVVELSAAFLGQIPADPAQRSEAQTATLSARLAQVTYTVTQFGDIRRAEVRSGGVTLDGDLERGDFTKPRGRPPVEKPPPGPPVAGTREVQERLVQLGYLPASAVDGLFGYRTQQAVMAFQSWEGLGRDGIVGPATTAALSTAGRPQPAPGRGPPRRIEVYRAKGVALLVRARADAARHPRVDRSGRQRDPDRALQGVPQGAAFVVRAVPAPGFRTRPTSTTGSPSTSTRTCRRSRRRTGACGCRRPRRRSSTSSPRSGPRSSSSDACRARLKPSATSPPRAQAPSAPSPHVKELGQRVLAEGDRGGRRGLGGDRGDHHDVRAVLRDLHLREHLARALVVLDDRAERGRVEHELVPRPPRPDRDLESGGIGGSRHRRRQACRSPPLRQERDRIDRVPEGGVGAHGVRARARAVDLPDLVELGRRGDPGAVDLRALRERLARVQRYLSLGGRRREEEPRRGPGRLRARSAGWVAMLRHGSGSPGRGRASRSDHCGRPRGPVLSNTATTSTTRFAGKPPFEECSRITASLSA